MRPPDLVEVRRVFGEPIAAAETIARYIDKLVMALCAALESRGLGVRRLDLIVHRVDSRVQAIRVGTALPVRDVKRLTRLLSDRIDMVDPGFGIEGMTLAAMLAEPLQPKQTISSLIEEPEADVSSLVDTLVNRVGERRLYRFSPVGSDVPERSVMRVAPLAPDTGEGWSDPWPRPPRLLANAEQIETVALLPDHPPSPSPGVASAIACGEPNGPERIFGEWWRAMPR